MIKETPKELSVLLDSLIKKKEIIAELNEKILELTSEDDVAQELEDADEYAYELEIKIREISDLTQTQNASQANQSKPQVLNPHAASFTTDDQYAPSTSTCMNYTYVPENREHITPANSTHVRSSCSTYSDYHKLPKLNLPTFTGNILNWQAFWDSYDTAVHSNPTLSEVQKFNYLKSLLQDEAYRTITGFALTNANYDKAISLLQERYGQKHKIVQTYMQALLEIPAPVYSLSSLRTFYDETETYVRGLESLGQTDESYGSLLVPVVLNKLPPQIRQNLARVHKSTNWTLNNLRNAIYDEVNVLEAGQLSEKSHDDDYLATATFLTHAKSRPKNGQRKPEMNHQGQRRTMKLCTYCDESGHFAINCTKHTSADARMNIVKRKKLCFNCLGNHKIAECKSTNKCKNCDKRHHTSLCKKMDDTIKPKSQQQENAVLHSSLAPQKTSNIMLKTAVVCLSSDTHAADANILLDEGAQRSFISEEFANKLSLKASGTEVIHLSGFGEQNRHVRHLRKAEVNLQTDNGGKIPISVLIVPEIAVPIQTHIKSVVNMKHLRGLKLAHPVSADGNFNINCLIGADYYWQIVGDKIIRGNGPTAVESKIGYLLSGPTANTDMSNKSSIFNILVSHKLEECNLERFWELESLGVENKVDNEKTEYQMYQDDYERSCISFEDNRYVAKLPWKTDHPPLPTNKAVALRRTENVIRRLSKEPQVLRKYGEIIQDQLRRGFIERVEENDTNQPTKIHYIPHHPVKKDSATTPIRIVYDCSCKQNPKTASLNDCLQGVPPQLNDITSILLRFRTRKYGVSTDIEKAFLNVGLDTADRNATRFFWLENPIDPKSQISTYRFRSILFGATCSPFILNAVLSKHLKESRSEVTDRILRDLYVDNIISSFDTEDELAKYFTETRSLFTEGGFNLRSWASNSDTLMKLATAENVQDKDITIKTLGLLWNTTTDMLGFSLPADGPTKYLTKREVLRESSKIYDPLGIITPVTVRSKIFMQTLWQQKMEWDVLLNDDMAKEWLDIKHDIHEVSKIKFPRHYLTKTTKKTGITTIHVFVDASAKAYGACAYLTSDDESCLMMARNRVAPLKSQTIPRLELMAAVLGSRLLDHITRTIDTTQAVLWSDSQIVLSWLNSVKTLKPFIANRVNEIKMLTAEWKWRYCPTDSNPADLLTRGVNAEKFKNSTLWTEGPDWLTCQTKWPTWNGTDENQIPSYFSEEEIVVQNVIADDNINQGVGKIINSDRFSSFKKLLRVTAYVQQFIEICRTGKRNINILTPEALQKAAITLIRDTQRRFYQDAIQSMKSGSKRNGLVRQLKLYLDDDDLIRCEGRIHNAPIEFSAKFPLLLPKNDRLTKLIVMDAHTCHQHAGLSSTITLLRQKYWIPSIRQAVKGIIHTCVKCRKVSGHPYKTGDPPPLPYDRLDSTTPFSVTGIDFTGALNVKSTDGTIKKVYICLFTCASTRAVHLEVVTDLTAETFMLAFRRFVSRRSIPKTIISDNATTFIAASKQIGELSRSTTVNEELNNLGTTWKFIPKRAPWFGGFWERMVGLTKTSIKKILGRSLINLETLQTIITEVETILNDRPLTYVTSDPLDYPLTPSKLLYGRRISSLPYPDDKRDIQVEINHESLNKRSTHQALLLSQFWSKWKQEYLTSLREYQRNNGKSITAIRKGDVVLVHDDSPRNKWTLAIVEELNKGRDDVTRSAVIRTNTGFTTRPVSKLYPLEVNTEDNKMDCAYTSPDMQSRNSRKAKCDAIQKIKLWTNVDN